MTHPGHPQKVDCGLPSSAFIALPYFVILKSASTRDCAESTRSWTFTSLSSRVALSQSKTCFLNACKPSSSGLVKPLGSPDHPRLSCHPFSVKHKHRGRRHCTLAFLADLSSDTPSSSIEELLLLVLGRQHTWPSPTTLKIVAQKLPGVGFLPQGLDSPDHLLFFSPA